MKTNKTLMTAALSGLMLAATVSLASADENKAGAAAGDPKDMGECHGINACKGTGACHGAGNSCAGTNACKGKGWVKTTKSDCESKGGTFKKG